MTEPATPPAQPLQEPWKQREGEPSYKVLANEAGAIVLQSLQVGITAAMVMRPDVAIWLGEQLKASGKRVKSGLILPGPGAIPPPNGNPKLQ
jgi:hypothetical protein